MDPDSDFDLDFDPESDDFGYDMSSVDDNPFGVKEEGEYTMVCTDVIKKYSNAGNPMFVFDFNICEGSECGKSFKVFCALTPAAMWKLSEVLVAMGLAEEGSKAKGKFTKKEAIGRTVIGILVNGEYRGKPSTSVETVKAHPKGHDYAEKHCAPAF